MTVLVQGKIKNFLPHRPPMLMIDRVMQFDERTIKTETDIQSDAFYLQGHFPDHPVMPGVIMMETIAQAGALLAALNELFEQKTQMLAFAGIEDAKFRKPVYPGETFCVFCEIVKHRRTLYKFAGEGRVKGDLVAQIMFSAVQTDR